MRLKKQVFLIEKDIVTYNNLDFKIIQHNVLNENYKRFLKNNWVSELTGFIIFYR